MAAVKSVAKKSSTKKSVAKSIRLDDEKLIKLIQQLSKTIKTKGGMLKAIRKSGASVAGKRCRTLFDQVTKASKPKSKPAGKPAAKKSATAKNS